MPIVPTGVPSPSSRLPSDRGAFTIKEVAAYLGIGRATLYREIDRGRLRTAKVGGRRLIFRHQLDGYLKATLQEGNEEQKAAA